jgi:acyl carrier protein
LETVQEGLRAIQEVQRQTAAAHEKFLEVQAEAQRSFQRIIESQQAMAAGRAIAVPQSPLPSVTIPAPPPVEPAPLPKAPEPMAPIQPEPILSAPKTAGSEVEAMLLSIVAELTGYPSEMLDASMDMEADLGIDSIKRVEILASLQKRMPGLPQLNTAQLGSLRTLRQVAEHVAAQSGVISEAPSPPATSGPAKSAMLEAELVAIVAELTGYPADMLSPDMDLEADLGIDSIKRVEILAAVQKRHPELRSASSAHYGALRTLRQVAERLAADAGSGPTPPEPAKDEQNVVGCRTEDISAVMLDVVAELTGYPRDMLSADMDM